MLLQVYLNFGNVATLPLRTAGTVFTNVTGIDAKKEVVNYIANNINIPKEQNKSDKLTQLSQIKEIEEKVKKGGNLTSSDLEVINSVNSSI